MTSSKKILFIGAPGSGKGTLSKILATKHNLIHISTGELFRKKIELDSEFAQKIQHFVAKGDYVPDEITNQLVFDFIQKIPANQGFILDGYPRTFAQLNFLVENKIDLDLVFYLNVENETILTRLSQRVFCQKCQKSYHLVSAKPKINGKCDLDGATLMNRSDDQPEVVKVRIEKFAKSAKPIEEYFQQQGKIHYLVAEKQPEELIAEIEKWL
ncbi:nucleoside monophosphate kinase [Mycoplasma sp. 'Moose RK']|uniref:adenylate kinase family protein n=1 Tax=Mycoplasma sp. 'Moose RK' TaxID=2780095 RepID=UPI0018C23DC0|nr:nucleoside monophosphate kinase [Mycoplasma sp. 'Moose RK']MBG0730809.1 nucleoside monophosphate kinase [Mycoplasma sp. 'Moose RK']